MLTGLKYMYFCDFVSKKAFSSLLFSQAIQTLLGHFIWVPYVKAYPFQLRSITIINLFNIKFTFWDPVTIRAMTLMFNSS